MKLQAPPTAPQKPQPQPQPQAYEFKLLTPMLGGGVDPFTPDSAQPFRTSGIMGQLRFWWRERYAAGIDKDDLRAEEAAIFGGPAKRGVFQLSVSQVKTQSKVVGAFRLNGKGKRVFDLDSNLPGYGAFSIKQFAENEDKPTQAIFSGSFKLNLVWLGASKDQQEKVCKALKLWANFGGLGTRWRRGFGALDCAVLRFTNEDDAFDHVDSIKAGSAFRNLTWKTAINAYQQFRQGGGFARRPKAGADNHDHESYWPEPWIIRQKIASEFGFMSWGAQKTFAGTDVATTAAAPGATSLESMAATANFMPRAAFGMPIVFAMSRDRLRGKSDKEFVNPTLVPVGKERMASPLIIRPIVLGTGNGKNYALFLALNRDDPGALELKPGKHDFQMAQSGLMAIDAAASRYQKSPLAGLDLDGADCPTGDAMAAFFNFLDRY